MHSWYNGKRSGTGICLFPDGTMYEGSWVGEFVVCYIYISDWLACTYVCVSMTGKWKGEWERHLDDKSKRGIWPSLCWFYHLILFV
jgi:hypothetical protein